LYWAAQQSKGSALQQLLAGAYTQKLLHPGSSSGAGRTAASGGGGVDGEQSSHPR